MRTRTRNMTDGKPAGLLLSVALPLMLGNVFQQLYTVVDTAVVGNVLGVSALAALGASDWFNWMFMSIVQGLTQGFSIPMAQTFGANDHDALRKTVAAATTLTAVMGVLVSVAALFLITPVLQLLQTPAEILPVSRLYLTIIFSATPVAAAYNLLACILRSLGDGRSPLFAMVVASVINVTLDLLFVAVFGFGVAGAAAATVIAQLCSCVFCLSRLRSVKLVHPQRSDFVPDWKRFAHLLRLGTPLALQNAIISAGGMIVQRVVNGMGVLFIAGYTATNKLYGMLEVAATSFGYATTTYVGQNLGANRLDRIRSGLRASFLLCMLCSTVLAAIMLLFGRSVLSLFLSGTPEDIALSLKYAYEFLAVMSVALPILYVLYVYRSALQGLGDTLTPMLSGVAEFFMRTGAALFLPGLIGYSGLFWAEVLAWAGAVVILVTSYYTRFERLCERAKKDLSAQ